MDSVIVNVPYGYELECTLAKKRVPSVLQIVDGAPARIRVLRGDEAPLVIRRTHDATKNGELPGFEMRAFDGHLYGHLTDLEFLSDAAGRDGAIMGRVSVTSPGSRDYADRDEHVRRDRRKVRGIDLQTFAEAMGLAAKGDVFMHSVLYPIPMPQHPTLQCSAGVQRDGLTISKIDRNEQADAAARASVLAEERIIVVDDMVYVRELEPRWSLRVSGEEFGKEYWWSIDLMRDHEKHTKQYKSRATVIDFRMDALDDAVALGGELGRQNPPWRDAYLGWEIVSDRAWSMDADRRVAAAWASIVFEHLEEFGQSFLGASDAFLETFMAVRRAAASPASLRETYDLVLLLIGMIKGEPSIPGSHAKRLLAMSKPVLMRIERHGFDDGGQASVALSDLEGFVL